VVEVEHLRHELERAPAILGPVRAAGVLEEFERLLERREDDDRLGGGHELLGAWRANNLAMVLHGEGRYQDALPMFERALALKTATLGANHFDVAVTLANVAFELHKMGRTEAAIERNQAALEVFEKTVGSEHPRVAFALTNAAEYLNAAGRFGEAQIFAERALAIFRKSFGDEHPDLAYPDLRIAIEYDDPGRSRRAHRGLKEGSDLEKDEALREVGWEVVRIRAGGLAAAGRNSVVCTALSPAVVDEVVACMRRIRGDAAVDALSLGHPALP